MIDTFSPVRTAYFSALNGNVSVTLPISGASTIPVYSHVPDDTDYPFIYIGNQSDTGGEDVATRTKDNKNATEHLIELYVVHGTRSADKNFSYQVVDDITDAVLQLVLSGTQLTFTGLENVTASYEGGTYEVEKNDTHIVASRQIVIRHLISQS